MASVVTLPDPLLLELTDSEIDLRPACLLARRGAPVLLPQSLLQTKDLYRATPFLLRPDEQKGSDR